MLGTSASWGAAARKMSPRTGSILIACVGVSALALPFLLSEHPKSPAPLTLAQVELAPNSAIRAQVTAGLPAGTLVQMKALGPRTAGELWVVPKGPWSDKILLSLVKPRQEFTYVTDGNVGNIDRIVKKDDPAYNDLAKRFLAGF